MTTRYCTSCGLDRREGERFCRNCGTRFDAGVEPDDTPTAPIVRDAPATVGAARIGTDVVPPPPAERPDPSTAPTEQAVQAPSPPTGPAVRTRPAFVPVAFGGGIALVVSVFLPWVSTPIDSSTALEVPVQALWDLDAGGGAVEVGHALLALGAIGGALAFVPRTAWVRRLCGGLSLAAVVAFLVQLLRVVDRGGGSFADLFELVGAGVYVALAGAIALIVSR